MASASSSGCQEQVGADEILLSLPFIFRAGGGKLKSSKAAFVRSKGLCPSARGWRASPTPRSTPGVQEAACAYHPVGEITHQPGHESAAR